MKKKYTPYLLVAPMVFTLIILVIYPSFYTVFLSFCKIIEGGGLSFIGIKNFIRLVTSSDFWNSVLITIKYTFGAVFFEFLLGLFIALLLKRISKGKTIFRALLILPLGVTPAISALTWRMIFNPIYGVANSLLSYIGITGVGWHTSANTALWSLILVDVWQWTPFMMLIIFAGLQMVPNELYEASALDGASFMTNLWYITIPIIKPVVAIGVIFRALDAFRFFDIIFVLTKGGPGGITETLVIKTFIEAFYSYNFGIAAAISVFMLIIAILCTKTIANKFI